MVCEQGPGTDGATQNAHMFKGSTYFLFMENYAMSIPNAEH